MGIYSKNIYPVKKSSPKRQALQAKRECCPWQ